MKRKLPPSFELEDLVHEGVLGLIQAARSFDPVHRTSERTWATRKITHAIQEAVRGKPYHYATARAELVLIERRPAPEPEAAEPSPHDEAVRRALALLPAQQQELLRALYEHNESMYSLRKRKALGLSWRGLQAQHDQALETLRPLLQKAA